MATTNANKVKFGLKNVHYSVVTETYTEGTGWESTYGTVKAWPGAVSMSISPEGEDNNFYADDGIYYVISSNAGYTGSFESALLPNDVLESVYGFQRDSNGLLVESNEQKKKYIALMFEVDGDSKATRYCFYRCMLSRANVDANTKENSVEPKTDSIDITFLPRLDDGVIKAMADAITCASTAGQTAYEDFYDEVPEPSIPAA